MSQIWDDLLTEEDQAVIKAAGYDRRGAATLNSRRQGQHPALLIIDMQRLYVGDDVPVLDAIMTAPSMIGERGWRAAEHILPLLEQCRAAGLPVYYLCMQPQGFDSDDPLLQVIEPLTPSGSDVVIAKQSPSGFYQTGLAEMLCKQGVDSVILVGNSTSGCIRAAAVDAMQNGFSVYVPHECVCDRIEASHKIGLLDIWMKIGHVLSTGEMQIYIEQLGSQRS